MAKYRATALIQTTRGKLIQALNAPKKPPSESAGRLVLFELQSASLSHMPTDPTWVHTLAQRVLVRAIFFRQIILYGAKMKSTHDHQILIQFCTHFSDLVKSGHPPTHTTTHPSARPQGSWPPTSRATTGGFLEGFWGG